VSAPGRSYDAARAALYALVPRGVVLGLEPMRAALAARGSPHARLPAVHVAGTNGKGSVAAMVDAALRAEGRRVGLYTSPHLHRFAERIRIDGTPCDQALLGEVAWEVLDAMAAGALPPLTFFEATTLMAWEAFARAGVETVVLEVGLGGRLDATNVCVPVATAITRIARDHEALLGSSLAEIAREKAGILKPDVPCVLGPDLARGEAREAIAAVAGEVGAPLHQAPMARVVATDATGTALSIETARGPLAVTLPLGGEHQAGNAAVAVGLLEVLGVAPEAIAGGLASVSWPARMERVGGLLFDVAHNPDGVAALVAALDRLPEPPSRRALVFGASHDKDWRGMLDLLAPRVPVAHRFYCAASLRRAEDPFALAAHAGGEACASVGEALSRARTAVGGEGLVVVCGSIYAVAEARALALGLPCDPPVPM
jgi:dihydrofolate synthase/folylpolyglutamate synthase